MSHVENEQLGDFRLERVIGQGGMGYVYQARQLSLDRLVAVKVLPQKLLAQPEFIERFYKEARAAGALTHPNVVQVYVCGVDKNTPYFAMEYLDGQTLKTVLERNDRLDIGEALRITESIARALVCAHDNGVVHRDIKPTNVMMDRYGTVKVLDFGLAKLTLDARRARGTQMGTFLGTGQYASPEQARGATIDFRTDIYSLGILLYEMLTGRTPFDGQSLEDILNKHLAEAPRPPHSLRSEIPLDVERICLRMIEKAAEDRYQDPRELLEDISKAAVGVNAEVQRRIAKGLEPAKTEMSEIMSFDSAPRPTTVPSSKFSRARATRLDYAVVATAVLSIGALGSAAFAWALGR